LSDSSSVMWTVLANHLGAKINNFKFGGEGWCFKKQVL